MNQKLYEELRPVIAKELSVPVEKVTPQAKFMDDLEADSLGLVTLQQTLEEWATKKAGQPFEIDDKEVENVRTVEQMVDYVESRFQKLQVPV